MQKTSNRASSVAAIRHWRIRTSIVYHHCLGHVRQGKYKPSETFGYHKLVSTTFSPMPKPKAKPIPFIAALYRMRADTSRDFLRYDY